MLAAAGSSNSFVDLGKIGLIDVSTRMLVWKIAGTKHVQAFSYFAGRPNKIPELPAPEASGRALSKMNPSKTLQPAVQKLLTNFPHICNIEVSLADWFCGLRTFLQSAATSCFHGRRGSDGMGRGF